MTEEITKAPSLDALLRDPNTTLQMVRDQLNLLNFNRRLAACMKLGKKAQRRLYELCKDSPCNLEDLVPADIGPRQEVILEGRNTLPLFKRFQKRFCWPESGEKVLYGYNEGATRWLIGPGYFVAHGTDAEHAEEGWPERAASVVNYKMVPPAQEEVAEGWPKIKKNSQGLQVLVYNGMGDFMRKVTDDVAIGSAYKNNKAIDSYFVLVRRPLEQAD